jgi:hypothetical protein
MTLKVKDADGNIKHVATTGTGTPGDPIRTQQNITGMVEVTIGAPLPAGNNNIGKVEVTAMPPVNVGEVTISDPLPAGDNNIGDVDIVSFPTVMVATDRLKVEATATELDIRSLSSTSDSVSAVQSGTWTMGISTLPVAYDAGAANTTTIRTVTASDSEEVVALGSPADAAAASDTSNASIIGLFKRLLARLTTLIDSVATELTLAQIRERLPSGGVLSEGAAASGITGPSGGSGAFKWLSGIWQLLSDRLPSLVSGRIPTETSPLVSPLTYTISHLPLNNANQEYNFNFFNVRKYTFKILSGGTVRFSNVANKVETSALPYYTLEPSAEEVQDFGINSRINETFYFASSTAGTVIIIQTWS